MSSFQKSEKDGILKILCPPQLDQAAASQFSEQFRTWLGLKFDCFVLDMSEVQKISSEFYKVILQLKGNLRSSQKSFFTIQMKDDLIRQLLRDGVDQIFSLLKSMDDVYVKMEKSSPSQIGKFDVGFLNAFLNAAVTTLKVQCNTTVKQQKPYMKSTPLEDIAIAGVIGINSQNYLGSIALCFPEKVFLRIYENMFSEKHEKMSNEVQDAAGELLNIIYGMAKTELNQKGYQFEKALPTVLAAEKLKIRQTAGPALIIPFEIDVGTFHIEIELTPAKGR